MEKCFVLVESLFAVNFSPKIRCNKAIIASTGNFSDLESSIGEGVNDIKSEVFMDDPEDDVDDFGEVRIRLDLEKLADVFDDGFCNFRFVFV